MMNEIVRKIWCCGAKSFLTEPEEGIGEEGRIRVWVGKEIQCKLEMEANFLNHPLFEELLRLSKEEFGYSYDGALRIACDIHLFQYLIQLLKTATPSTHYMQFSDLISQFRSNSSSSTEHLLLPRQLI